MIDLSKKSFVEVMDARVLKIYDDIKQTMFDYFESAIKENTSAIIHTDRSRGYIFSLRGNGKTSILAQLFCIKNKLTDRPLNFPITGDKSDD